MNIEIVPVRAEHIEGFHAVLDEVAREQRYLTLLQAPPLGDVATFVRRAIAGGFVQHVVLDAGQVVGWCDVLPGERPAMRHAGRLGVGLLESHRNRGLGARLIGSVLAEARLHGLVRIALSVRADNLRAIRLYERLGFQHEGRARRDLRIGGVDYDSLNMAICLDEPDAAWVDRRVP